MKWLTRGEAALLGDLDWLSTAQHMRRMPGAADPCWVWNVAPDKQRADSEALLAHEVNYATMVAPSARVTSAAHDAHTVPALIADAGAADLAVVGNRGRGGFASLALGSVGMELTAHAPCPVIVVRAPAVAAEAGPSAGRVVVGVDGSAAGQPALAFAFEEASLRGVGLTAVHAWSLPAVPTGVAGELRGDVDESLTGESLLLAEALAGWQEKYPDVDCVEKTRLGHVGRELIDESRGAVLVVVGSRGRGGFTGLLLGSTSQALLHHASCPVAVVRKK
jgi:nucleotide-binding universal stress UspA family protein